jgi:hypothetical protein
MVNVEKVDAALDQMNKTIGLVLPLVATVGGLARLLLSLAHKQGLDTKPFEDAIAELDAQKTELRSAIDEFRTKYPREA